MRIWKGDLFSRSNGKFTIHVVVVHISIILYTIIYICMNVCTLNWSCVIYWCTICHIHLDYTNSHDIYWPHLTSFWPLIISGINLVRQRQKATEERMHYVIRGLRHSFRRLINIHFIIYYIFIIAIYLHNLYWLIMYVYIYWHSLYIYNYNWLYINLTWFVLQKSLWYKYIFYIL